MVAPKLQLKSLPCEFPVFSHMFHIVLMFHKHHMILPKLISIVDLHSVMDMDATSNAPRIELQQLLPKEMGTKFNQFVISNTSP